MSMVSGLRVSVLAAAMWFSAAALAGECGGDAGGTACSAGSPGMIRHSVIEHKGDLVFGDEPLGSGAGLALRLTEEEVVPSLGTHFGQWSYELTGYVSTAEATGTVPPGASQVKVHEAGGGYKVYRFNGICADGAGSRCVYEKDELSGKQLLRVRGELDLPSTEAFRPLGSELAVTQVQRVLTGLGSDAARAYVQSAGDGNYAIYGKIRSVSGGYEAWLSHRVDRLGSVSKINYDEADGMLRVASIEDAYGLKTRFFYMDSEPLLSGEGLSNFADRQTSESLKRYWRHALELLEGSPAARRVWKGLVVSAVDAYGNRARFDYVDGLTGLRLRGMDALDGIDLDGRGPESLIGQQSTILTASVYPRLARVTDAVGVASTVEYACGIDAASSEGMVHRSSEVALRDSSPIGTACIHPEATAAVERFGSDEASTRWLFRRVKAIETPFGRTQFHRVVRSDGDGREHYAGWAVEDAVGNIERFEVMFGEPSFETRQRISAWIDAEQAAGRSVRLRGVEGGMPRVLADAEAANARGLRELYALATGPIAELKDEWSYRNSYHWSQKAVAESGLSRDQLLSADTLLPLQLAEVTHHLHDQKPGQVTPITSHLAMARKSPLRGFVYVGYQGQSSQEHYRGAALDLPGTNRVSAPALTLMDIESVGGLATQLSYAEYGAKGQLLRSWDAQGQGQERVYASNGVDLERVYRLAPGTRNREGEALVTMSYNGRGQVERIVNEQGYESTYAYEAAWPYRVIRSTVPVEQGSAGSLRLIDERYRTMTYQTVGPLFDRAQAELGPAQTTATVTVTDGHGQSTTSIYNNGLLALTHTLTGTTTYDYHNALGEVDGFGRVSEVYLNDALQTHYEYDGLSLRSVTDALGNRVEYANDHLNRVVQAEVRDSSGVLAGWTFMTYDLAGGVSAYWKMGGAMGPYQMQALFEYDVAGRPIRRADQDGLRSSVDYYANSGMPSQATDPAGVVNRYRYDRYGRLSNREVVSPTIGVVRTMGMDYEPAYGRVRSVTDNGQVSTFEYQERGRRYAGVLGNPSQLTQSTVPFTDAAGNPHTVSTTYQGYDGMGRLLGYQSVDDLGNGLPSMDVRFDALGRVEQYNTEVSRVRTDYEDYNVATEDYGRVKGLRYDLNGDATNHELVQTLSYYKGADFGFGPTDAIPAGYDLHVGKLKSRSYHFGATASSNPLPTGLGPVFRRLSYDGNHRLAKIDGYLGTKSRRYEYDGASRLIGSREYQGDSGLGGKRYSYDESGNPLSTRDVDASGNERMGNRQEQSYGLSHRLYSYLERDEKLNAIANNCKKGLEHDAAGRLLQDPTNCNTRYRWDAEGHLIQVQYDEMNWTQIEWNGSNQWTRIVEVINGSPKDDKTYVWPMGGTTPSQIRETATGKLLTSFNGDGYQTYQYDPWGNITTERFILLRDHQGSVIGLTNQQGEQVEAIEYDDWGNITRRQTRNPITHVMEDASTARTHTGNLPLQYAGYFWLKRADLALTPNRAYHPKIKRWLSKDPIGEAGGDNLYMYVANIPNMLTDPTGLNPGDGASQGSCQDLIARVRQLESQIREILDSVRQQIAAMGGPELFADVLDEIAGAHFQPSYKALVNGFVTGEYGCRRNSTIIQRHLGRVDVLERTKRINPVSANTLRNILNTYSPVIALRLEYLRLLAEILRRGRGGDPDCRNGVPVSFATNEQKEGFAHLGNTARLEADLARLEALQPEGYSDEIFIHSGGHMGYDTALNPIMAAAGVAAMAATGVGAIYETIVAGGIAGVGGIATATAGFVWAIRNW